MGPDRIKIEDYDKNKGKLERVHNLPMFSDSSQQAHFHELTARALESRPTDSLTDKTDKFFSKKTKIYYKKETGSYVLAHNNKEIAGFENEEILKQFIAYYASVELQMHQIDVQASVNQNRESILTITERQMELTNLKLDTVQAYAESTKQRYKALLDRISSHINALRTLHVRETGHEIREYKKLKILVQNIIQDINRIQSRLGARNIINEPRLLNTAQREISFLNNNLLDKLDKSINGTEGIRRFTANIPEDYIAKQRLYTVRDYAEWFGYSFEQDAIKAQQEGIETQYNRQTALVNGRDIDQRNAYMRYAQAIWDPTTQAYIVPVIEGSGGNGRNGTVITKGKGKCSCNYYDKNGNLLNKKIFTAGNWSDNFFNNFESGGLVRASGQLLIDGIEQGIGRTMTPGEKKLARVAGLAGGIFLLWKAIQAGRKGLEKIGGDSTLGKLAALGGLEVGSILLTGHSITGTALGAIFGGKGSEALIDLAEYVGLKDPLEMEAGQPNQPARVFQTFGTMKQSDFAKLITTRNDGKYDIDRDKAMIAYPGPDEHIQALRDSENKDIIHNFFTRMGTTPEEMSQNEETVGALTREVMERDNKIIIDALTNHHLTPKKPQELTNWKRIIDSYDESKTMEENIRLWKNEGLLQEIEPQIPRQADLKKVAKLFSGLTIGEINDAVGGGKDVDTIDMDKISALMTAKGKKTQYDTFINQVKVQNATAMIQGVFDIVGLSADGGAFDTASQQGLMVEKFILEYQHKKIRENEFTKFVRQEGLTIHPNHMNKKSEFINDASVVSELQVRDKLNEYLTNGYFIFEHRSIEYLKDQDAISSTMKSRLDGIGYLNEKQRITIAALTEKLNGDFSPHVSIDFVQAPNNKLTLVFKGSKERKDRDGKAIGKNNMKLTFDPNNMTINEFMDSTGKKVSFKDSVAKDGGLVGMILRGVQYGMIKEAFEGQSTIAGNKDGTQGPFSEEFFSSNAQFHQVGFLKKWKQGLLDLSWSDIIPGNDFFGVLTKYWGSLGGTSLGSTRYKHVPVMGTDAGMKATVAFYNSRMDRVGNSIWQSGHERNEAAATAATIRKLRENGLVAMGFAKTGEVFEAIDSKLTELSDGQWDRFKGFLSDLLEAGITITGTLVYGALELMKGGAELLVSAGKLLIDTGKGIVKVTREAFIALAEKIKNGEISVLEVAGYTVLAAGTVAAGVALFSGLGTGMASKALAAGAAPIQGIAKMKRRGQLLLLAGVGLTDHLANDGRIRKRLTGLVTGHKNNESPEATDEEVETDPNPYEIMINEIAAEKNSTYSAIKDITKKIDGQTVNVFDQLMKDLKRGAKQGWVKEISHDKTNKILTVTTKTSGLSTEYKITLKPYDSSTMNIQDSVISIVDKNGNETTRNYQFASN